MTVAVSSTREKTRIELLDGTHPEGGPTGETIFMMEEKLHGLASFTKLHNGTKRAVSKGVNKTKKIHAGNNYGVYPEGDLIILDIDVKDATSPEHATQLRERQLDVLEQFFDVPLRKTFSVITPTGGVHCYLRLPHDFSLREDAPKFPKVSFSGKVSRIVNDILANQHRGHVRRKLTVDVRRPDINSYVLGPGSWLDNDGIAGKYNVAFDNTGFSRDHFDAPILHISSQGAQNMVLLSKELENIALAERIKTQRKLGIENPIDDVPAREYPSEYQIRSLRKLVRKHKLFHSKRASVKAALSCCYTDEVIAQVCVELRINRDSSKQEPLSLDATLRDIERFVIEEPYHSPYCQADNMKKAHIQRQGEPMDRSTLQEVLLEKSRQELERKKRFVEEGARRRHVNPAVIDVRKVHHKLMATTNRRVMPQAVRDALDIVDYYLQPLSNYGVIQIILSRAELQKTLGFTQSRVTAATRLLRETEIMYIDTPPQPGRTTVYAVQSDMFHDDLSWALRKTWGYNNARRKTYQEVHPAALFYDRMTGSFREVFSGQIVNSPNRMVHKVLESVQMVHEYPVREQTGPGAALRYIRSEAKQQGVEVVPLDDTRYTIVDTESGQIIVEDWDVATPVKSFTIEEYIAKTGYTPRFRGEQEGTTITDRDKQSDQNMSLQEHEKKTCEANHASNQQGGFSHITVETEVQGISSQSEQQSSTYTVPQHTIVSLQKLKNTTKHNTRDHVEIHSSLQQEESFCRSI